MWGRRAKRCLPQMVWPAAPPPARCQQSLLHARLQAYYAQILAPSWESNEKANAAQLSPAMCVLHSPADAHLWGAASGAGPATSASASTSARCCRRAGQPSGARAVLTSKRAADSAAPWQASIRLRRDRPPLPLPPEPGEVGLPLPECALRGVADPDPVPPPPDSSSVRSAQLLMVVRQPASMRAAAAGCAAPSAARAAEACCRTAALGPVT